MPLAGRIRLVLSKGLIGHHPIGNLPKPRDIEQFIVYQSREPQIRAANAARPWFALTLAVCRATQALIPPILTTK